MSDSLSSAQQRAILLSTILASSMAFIDSTALNVALPALQEDLDIKGSELLWIVNGYALFLSALLLVGGSLGDLYGRKRIFAAGIVLFTISSILCGISNSAITLIASRCLQGIGGALMVPGSLSIISSLFPKEKRGAAIGTWSMFSAMTTILGPALGGWLAEMGLWRMVFFINVPLAITSLFFLFTYVPEAKNPNAKKIDLTGAILATLALGGLTYAFIEGPSKGFDSAVILISLTGGTISLLLFIFAESRMPNAMMPLNLFKSRVFTSTNFLTLLLYGALGGFLFFFPLNLIQIQGYPAELAGLTVLPMGLLVAFLSRWSGAWADKVGVRKPLILGPLIAAIGFYLFSVPNLTNGLSDFWTTFFPALIFLGSGMGITVAPLTTAVMNAVDSENAGIASGVNNTMARTAGVLGVASLGAFALLTFTTTVELQVETMGLSTEALSALQTELPKFGDAQAPLSLSEAEQTVINASIKSAFITAFKRIAVICAFLALGSSVIAMSFLKKKKPEQ